MSTAAPASGRVLVVDDEPGICRSLCAFLEGEGHRAVAASSAEEALGLVATETPDVAFVDLRLPGMDGLGLLQRLGRDCPGLRVVLITAYGEIDVAIRATQHGAYAYLPKPFDLDDIAEIMASILAPRSVAIAAECSGSVSPQELVLRGDSAAAQSLREALDRCAMRSSPVLFVGETGSGREPSARALHARLGRDPKRFRAVRCGSEEWHALLEEALRGVREAGTTRFVVELDRLDPVADGPALAALASARHDDGPAVMACVRPGTRSRHAPADGVVASLRARGWSIVPVPPLRERLDDLPRILPGLLARVARELGRPLEGLDGAALDDLRDRPWRGNFHELANAVRTAAVRSRGSVVGLDAVRPPPLRAWR